MNCRILGRNACNERDRLLTSKWRSFSLSPSAVIFFCLLVPVKNGTSCLIFIGDRVHPFPSKTEHWLKDWDGKYHILSALPRLYWISFEVFPMLDVSWMFELWELKLGYLKMEYFRGRDKSIKWWNLLHFGGKFNDRVAFGTKVKIILI